MVTAFSIPRKPLSLNAKLSEGYVQALSLAARECHSGAPFDGPLYSRILWFHKRSFRGGDIDNVAKRIHDALKRIVFDDDQRITHALAIRIDATEAIDVQGDPENQSAFAELSEMIGDPEVRDVLYVEIGFQPKRRIHLGPITP